MCSYLCAFINAEHLKSNGYVTVCSYRRAFINDEHLCSNGNVGICSVGPGVPASGLDDFDLMGWSL